jgi:transposase
MFGFGSATRIYLAMGATDMRKGFDGLLGLVKHRLEEDPLPTRVAGSGSMEDLKMVSRHGATPCSAV